MAHQGYKRDGLTPDKRKTLLAALALYGNAKDACRVAGISTTTYYRHLKKEVELEAECQAARAKAAKPLETLAYQRATEGAAETVIRNGEVVQVKVKPSDAILGMLLKASDPGKYAPGVQALREKIEAELRPQIEAEARAEIERRERIDGPKLRAEFDQMLSDFNRRMGGNG
jgi:hypothetical protein